MGEALMERLMAGKEAAYKEIYDRFYEKLFTSAYGIVKNTQDAEDTVIVTFEKLFKRHTQFQSIEQVQTWLFISTRNSCIDILRRRRVQGPRDKEFRELNVQELENQSFNDELDIMLLEKAMALVGELPPQSQKVIRLRYLEGLKYKEIAEQMHISPRTVENLLRFALDKLRRQLGHKKLVFVLFMLESLRS